MILQPTGHKMSNKQREADGANELEISSDSDATSSDTDETQENDGFEMRQNEELIHGGKDNFGFNPLPEDKSERRGRKRKQSEEDYVFSLKREISKLLCQYPKLTIRSSNAMMSKLDELSPEELKNVYQNCLNDVTQLRGNPVATGIIHIMTTFVNNKYINGFTEECLKDEELKRNIDLEYSRLLGDASSKVIILLQLINNAYNAMIKTNGWSAYLFNNEAQKIADEEQRRKNNLRPDSSVNLHEEGNVSKKQKTADDGEYNTFEKAYNQSE